MPFNKDEELEYIQKKLKKAIELTFVKEIAKLEKIIEDLKKPQLLQIVRDMTHKNELEETELNERYYIAMLMGMSKNLIDYSDTSLNKLKNIFSSYLKQSSLHKITMSSFVHEDFRYLLQL
ncbi:hypothetical protein LCGC14_0175460 [marine sediment metagenome]|uniref:Uncharacterized protein n=1 Tax=marine sediment metagenome TaxID=412755 RepID=A0A0F9V7I1_9ZZZZ